MRVIARHCLFLLLVLPTLSLAGEPMQFDRYHMIFLYRGDNPPALNEDAAARLQEAHLQHLTQLWEGGHALVAGPFGGGEDEPLRGIVLLRGDLSVEQAQAFAEADPAVKAGRLKVKVLPWFTEAGVLAFPKSPAK